MQISSKKRMAKLVRKIWRRAWEGDSGMLGRRPAFVKATVTRPTSEDRLADLAGPAQIATSPTAPRNDNERAFAHYDRARALALGPATLLTGHAALAVDDGGLAAVGADGADG